MAEKIVITKDITTVQTQSAIGGKVLNVKYSKLGQSDYVDPIPLSQKGAINGVATLDSNGNVVQKSNLNIEVQPIGLNSPAPSKDGIFMPVEVGIYPNYGNLELTQHEKDYNIVYFYLLNGQFSKVVKSVDISGKANVDGGNITNVAQWKQKLGYIDLSTYYSVIDADNISDSGIIAGYQWQNIPENGIGYLETIRYSPDWYRQFFNRITGEIWYRDYYYGSTFGQWRKLWTESNFNPSDKADAIELNNVYDQISARANDRLSNLASDLSTSEKQAIRQKLGL